jgi:hypothetical protein
MKPITVKEWFLTELYPILEDVNKKLVEGATKNKTDIAYAEWWAVFIKDTFSLFEIFEKENQTRQFAMTVRSLMEFAADVSFLAKYPKNIAYQQNRFNRFVANKKQFTYKEVAEESKKYKLREYIGDRKKDEVPTGDRIKLAFNANEVTLYDYLNCFTHFNIFGIRIDLNIHQANSASILSERLVLVQFYPKIFEIMTISMGKICEVKELEQYDFSVIKNLFRNMDKNWKLANN